MAGASPNHVLIAANVSASLHFQLRKRPCFVYQSDLHATLELPSIDCTLALADVYEKVTFEGEQPA